ncbi:MAG TPA: radical SAM protein [Thermoanaerobaculia bacterium]|nr:radical SAM protein [Thermoanaerobaculia bacterium]
MKGEPGSLRRSFALFRDPATAEKRRILAERWAGLDPALRLPGQGLGQKATGCGATIGIQPRCDFACTGCYLGAEANRIPALPTAAILRQLDEMRRWLGPKSNVQITDGEVTLRPTGELVEILSYARSIGIIPMVMTHGDNFRRQPGLLERLMVEGSLTEVSIHVDITQRGRDGHKAPKSELELMPLREELAGMVREARRRTARTLRAAMTLTVTQDNLPQIADVVRWLIRNRDAFSLVSFQPLAQVGRTRKSQHGVTADELWTEIAKGTKDFGLDLRGAGPMHFGHTDCTRFVPLLTLERPGGDLRVYQFIRDEPEDVAVMSEFFARGLGGMAFRDDRPLELAARALGFIRTDPHWLLGRVRRWAAGRFRTEAGTSLGRLLVDILRGQVHLGGFTLTSHHFMNPAELQTEVGQARLAACVFRLPYEGKMVPMCQMNADGVRERFYAGITAGEPERRSLPVVH